MSSDSLQFQHAEPLGPITHPQCSACKSEITESHYKLNGSTMCLRCADAIQAAFAQGPSRRDLLRAMGYGIAAALIGMLVYFAIVTATGLSIGWIAVGVGWLTGKAVQKGGRGIGGRKLQAIAIVLTYCAISIAYGALGMKMAIDQHRAAMQQQILHAPFSPIVTVVLTVAVAVGIGLAMPFLLGTHGIFLMFMLAIGVYEAWRLNRPPLLQFEGPFGGTAVT